MKWIYLLVPFSGTYNNEWMIFDYNKLSSSGLADGAFTVLEQLPGKTVSKQKGPLLSDCKLH